MVAHGTQDQERVSIVPSRGDLLAFVAALLATVAVFGEVLALVIVWMTSVDGAGSTYLEGMAIFGVIPGLLLAGSVLLHRYARQGRWPRARVVGGVVLVSLLVMQAVLFAAGQVAGGAGTGQDVAGAQACSPEDVALLLDLGRAGSLRRAS